MTRFWTLLGPDFSGKSTALARLRDEHGWQVVSHDDLFLDHHPLVAKLRSCWVEDGLRHSGTRYTHELVLAVMHAVILHQRDELARQCGPAPVIVDSYFYKVLTACTLLGVVHEPTFAYWRTFPQPQGVIYLDVPPDVTWERSGRGAQVTAFEHYGATVDRSAFVRMQQNLRDGMLAAVQDLPVTVIDGTAGPDTVLAKIVAAIGRAPC